jgi:hypothetical protein
MEFYKFNGFKELYCSDVRKRCHQKKSYLYKIQFFTTQRRFHKLTSQMNALQSRLTLSLPAIFHTG